MPSYTNNASLLYLTISVDLELCSLFGTVRKPRVLLAELHLEIQENQIVLRRFKTSYILTLYYTFVETMLMLLLIIHLWSVSHLIVVSDSYTFYADA